MVLECSGAWIVDYILIVILLFPQFLSNSHWVYPMVSLGRNPMGWGEGRGRERKGGKEIGWEWDLVLQLTVGPKSRALRTYGPCHLVGPGPSFLVEPGPSADSGLLANSATLSTKCYCWTRYHKENKLNRGKRSLKLLWTFSH